MCPGSIHVQGGGGGGANSSICIEFEFSTNFLCA